MNPNFVKTENGNDIDNEIETEPKTRHSTLATQPEEVDEPQKIRLNFEKHQVTPTRSGRRVIKPSRFGE